MRILPRLLVAAAVMAAAPPAAATTIVYTCDVDICSVDPETGARRAITTNGTGGLDYYDAPFLSSDGRLLAFWYDDRPYVANRRARNRREVRPPAGPRQNAFVPQFRAGSHEGFFFYGVSTSMFTSLRLCRSTDVVRRRPRCGETLPGGRAYWAWGPNRTILSIDSDLRRDICVTSLDGVCRRVLVRLPQNKTFFMPPSTSPNDRHIAAGVDQGIGSDDTRIELFSARTGRRIRSLTRGHTDYPPSFSPDGRWIAFRRDAIDDGNGVRASICVVRTRGGRARCLVRRGRNVGRPIWGG